MPAVSMAADAPSIDKNDPFMVPEVKQRPKYLDPVGSLQKQIVILRTQLDEGKTNQSFVNWANLPRQRIALQNNAAKKIRI